MPNEIAYLALFLWPLLCIVVYQSTDALAATSFTLLGGFLLLPERVSFDAPLVPPLDKESLSALIALVMLYTKGKVSLLPLPPPGFLRICVLALVFGPVITVFNNAEPVIMGDRYIKGLTAHDAFSAVVSGYLGILPFILAINLVKTTEDMHRVLKHLLVAGLCVSVPALYEARMSPQLHSTLYGFFPHSFGQQKRFGGFRPVVFAKHGLWLAMFFATTLASAAVFVRTNTRVFNLPPVMTLIYLIFVLILCKSVGPAVLGLFMVLTVLLLPLAWTSRLIALLAGITIFYPLLNLIGWFPKADLLDLVASFSADRASSLNFRFEHESALLGRALEKPWFGWGTWGRNRLEDSVTDGYWVITLGSAGLTGFAAVYGIIASTAMNAVSKIRSVNVVSERAVVLGVVIIAVMLGVNSIPNSAIGNVAWYLIGTAAVVRYLSLEGHSGSQNSKQTNLGRLESAV